MTGRTAGKVAIVTGASSGMGAATARLFASEGARVVLIGRNKERLETVHREIEDAGGVSHAVAVDIANADAGRQIVDEAVGAYGRIDIVVHCAAQFIDGPLADATLDEMDLMWAVNVRAPLLLVRSAIPHLGSESAIVLVSSTVAHAGFANFAAYSATKGAVEALARSLAIELAPNTRVNVIAPGFVETPMLTDQYPKVPGLGDFVLSKTPLGFIAQAEDLAEMIVTLSCPATRYVTGATLVCDGGWLANG